MNFSIKNKPLSAIRRLSVALGLLLASCAAVGPDYTPPDPSAPHAWNTPLEAGLAVSATGAPSLADWWQTFNDPILSRLIERAVAGNLDLRQAGARVREARARRGVADAGRFPTVTASGAANWSRGSGDSGSSNTRELYSAGFDAGWELDIFGGVRRSIEAAEADLQASREDLRDVLVSLTAEVALNYLDARTFQKRLSVAEENLTAQEETYRLIQVRYTAGLSDELATEQARYNLENTRSQIPTLRTGLEAAQNRIAVLLGTQPGAVHAELAPGRRIPVSPPQVVVGVPADALRRRPDVRRTERALAAQTARIGVATAELYPKFTLSGSIGLEALSPGGLFSIGSRVLGLAPRINWPLFDAGAIRRNIEIQSSLQAQALAQYDAAILSALEEVENALVAYAQEQYRRQSLTEATRAAQRANDLAQQKYDAGLTDFNNVLDAQRSLLSFQDQLAQSDGTVSTNLIRLYKALGGGWTALGT